MSLTISGCRRGDCETGQLLSISKKARSPLVSRRSSSQHQALVTCGATSPCSPHDRRPSPSSLRPSINASRWPSTTKRLVLEYGRHILCYLENVCCSSAWRRFRFWRPRSRKTVLRVIKVASRLRKIMRGTWQKTSSFRFAALYVHANICGRPVVS